MENASKALLMAAGVFLVMLILALVIFAWGKFSDYQNAKDSLVDIEDTAKFNEQFTHYDRDDVQGYEILSLANQVIDYNRRRADVGQNNEKYNPIKLVVTLNNDNKKFSYDENNLLINSNEYTISSTVNTFDEIIAEGARIERTYGSNVSQISKLISLLFSDEVKNDENKKANAVKKFNSLSKTKVTNYNELLGYKNDIYKYYEYMQFKKGVFNCENLTYDNSTGRVNNMKFTFSGKIY
mgnify:CR=1 FL=1